MRAIPRVLRSSVTAYVLIAAAVGIGQIRLEDVNRADVRRIAAVASADAMKNCTTGLHDWEAIQHVVAAATNPPSRRGEPLTAAQRVALAAYARSLLVAAGPRPEC